MKILIVDDSIHVHRQLKVFLGSGGFNEIIYAHSADEAFEYLGMTKQISHCVDLILMDIGMDGMDGIEATQQIKRRQEFLDLPIIMVTGDASSESLGKAFDAGAVDYITKPIKKIELLARVNSVLMLCNEVRKRKEREDQLIQLTKELEFKNAALKKANDILGRLAEIDGLTGIANRRFFDITLEQEWQRVVRSGKRISLIMIDIDFFKYYNDHYGHLKGDECLKKVAQKMEAILNRPGDFIARYGGEEFAVILPETDAQGAIHMAILIHKAVADLKIPHEKSSISDNITISLGIAMEKPVKTDNREKIILMADQALYQAKVEGRNRWQFSQCQKR